MSVVFDGINQYLSRSSALISSSPCTFACFFKAGDVSESAGLFAVTDISNDIYLLQARDVSGNLSLRGGCLDGGSWGLATATSYYTLSNWHHACMVFNSTTLRAAFLDGANKGTNTDSKNPTGMGFTTLGTYNMSNCWQGKVAHLAIWNIALSDAEVNLLSNGADPTIIQSANLVSYYPLYDNPNDAHGSNNFTEYNSPTYDTGDNPVLPDSSVKLSGLGSFLITAPVINVSPEAQITGLGSFLITNPNVTNINNLGEPNLAENSPTAWFRVPGKEIDPGNVDPRYNVVKPWLVNTISGTGDPIDLDIIPLLKQPSSGSHIVPPTKFEDCWWEQAHILPRIVQDVGHVVSEQAIDVELHNADRYDSLTITSVTDNLGTGVIISGVPSVPFDIASQRSLSAVITVQRSGSLTIDASYTFHDSEGGSYTIYIIGSRVVMFPVRPEAPMKEHIQFSTKVLEKIGGTEQRICLRDKPRTMFDFTIKGPQNRQQTEFALFDRQAKTVALPMWHEPAFCTDAVVASGSTVINLQSTADRNFYIGGYAVILQDEFTYDAMEIIGITATTLTVKSGIEFAYDGNVATVMPLALAYIAPKVSATKFYKDVETFNVKMTIDIQDNDIADASGWSVFNGKVLLDDPNMMDNGGLREDIETKTYDKSTVASLISKLGIWDHSKRNSFKGFKTNTRAELWKVRQLLHFLRGRQVSFYIPTFMDEITPTGTLINANSSLTMKNIGYTTNVQDRWPKNYLRVVLNDGTIVEKSVVASAEVDNEFEQLTVSTPWPYDIPVSDINRIEFLEKVRINVDDIVIIHYNALGQSKCTVPIREVFD